MSSKNRNKKQKEVKIVVINQNVIINQVIIVKEQKPKRKKWILRAFLCILTNGLIYPIVGKVITRLPKIMNLIENLVSLLSV